jgi:quinone-modifying oxidoreductase subunit QmoC
MNSDLDRRSSAFIGGLTNQPAFIGGPKPLLVEPDTKFISDVLNSGGGDLKKCFQCATCSVACSLAPEDQPFPRKQMIEAQWGLKERLAADPAVWLCHNCGDCTRLCPRGAKPGEVLGALRNQTIQHFAFPRILGRLAARPRGLLVLLLIPVILFWAIAAYAPKGEPTPGLQYADLYPLEVLEPLFFLVAGLSALGFVISTMRFVKALRAAGAAGKILPGFLPALKEILKHQRFAQCASERGRFWGHLLTMYGFLGLGVMGTVVGIGSMAGLMHTPLAMTDPWKVFANVCAVVIAIGCVLLIVNRLTNPDRKSSGTYFDWFFLIVLTGVVATGILSQFLRLAESAAVMYPVYFVHLVLIFSLFLYAPHSKFAHLVYRTVAMAASRKA